MNLVVVGASGHGKVICDVLLASGEAVKGFADDNANKWGGQLMGLPILGNLESLPTDTQLIIAIGDNFAREKVFSRAQKLAYPLINAIHPSAIIGRGCRLGVGVAVFANVVLNVDTQIGDNVILNTACTVDHDCLIGAHSHIAPGAHLAGNVKISEGTLVGVGASIIPGVKVGAHCVIGAGSVVISDVEDYAVVVGNPARVIKSLRGAKSAK